MARYGNILTVFQCTQQQVLDVEAIFAKLGTDFAKFDNAYFIETNSKVNTGDLINDLKALAIKFILFHNHDPDGSKLEATGIAPPEVISHIKQILFE